MNSAKRANFTLSDYLREKDLMKFEFKYGKLTQEKYDKYEAKIEVELRERYPTLFERDSFELFLTVKDVSKLKVEFKKLLEIREIIPNLIKKSLMKLIVNFMSEKSDTTTENWTQHRNLCVIVEYLLSTKFDLILKNNNFVDYVLEYVIKLLEFEPKFFDLILWVILAIEKLCFIKDLDVDKKRILQEKLSKFSTLNFVPNSNTNFEQIQVNFESNWCLTNFFDNSSQKPAEFPIVKTNNLMVRNDSEYPFITVRSQFPITSRIFYYETTLITSSACVRIGWATREAELSKEYGIGKPKPNLLLNGKNCPNKHSIAFDTLENCVYYGKNQFSVKNSENCKTGDVIGSLIDTDNQKFSFYLNGKLLIELKGKKELNEQLKKDRRAIKTKIEYAKRFPKRNSFDFDDEEKENAQDAHNDENDIKMVRIYPQPYYACASLTAHAQCYFNFGQTDFKFAPNQNKFKNSHKESNKTVSKYQFSETQTIYKHYQIYYWFKGFSIDDPFYRDSKQDEYDKVMRKIEENICKNRKPGTQFPDEKANHLRVIQSFIETLDKEIHEFQYEKLDVLANWFPLLIGDYFQSSNLEGVVIAHACELLYPYIQTGIQNLFENSIKQRNLSIVLATTVIDCFEIMHGLNLKTTFVKMLEKDENVGRNVKWMKIFALIGLEKLYLEDSEKIELKNNEKMAEFFDQISEEFGENCYTLTDYRLVSWFLDQQLRLCAYWFWKFALKLDEEDFAFMDIDEVNLNTLNPRDRTENLKIFPDFLSVRSDNDWQSIRAINPVVSGIGYYEVVILTSGPMRFGWSTKDTVLESTYVTQKALYEFIFDDLTGKIRVAVGGDRNSIGYDGYKRCCWHQDKHNPVLRKRSKWNVGDVIGCWINVEQQKFVFYHNGEKVFQNFLGDEIYFSEDNPYYATLGLSRHQQCFVNFGQFEFRFAPKEVVELDLVQNSGAKLEYRGDKFINFQNLTNVSININSNVRTRDIRFVNQQQQIFRKD